MEVLILAAIFAGVAYGAFRHGKRLGSRLGYGAGRWRRKRHRRR